MCLYVCVCVLTANLFTLFLAVRHFVLEEGEEIGEGGGEANGGRELLLLFIMGCNIREPLLTTNKSARRKKGE